VNGWTRPSTRPTDEAHDALSTPKSCVRALEAARVVAQAPEDDEALSELRYSIGLYDRELKGNAMPKRDMDEPTKSDGDATYNERGAT
jgi:hypothetical protein